MKKQFMAKKISVLVLYFIILIPLIRFTDILQSNFSLGVLLSVIWFPIDALCHELGHAVVLRAIEGNSCICFRNFIGKKVYRISFFKIDIYFVNEKGYGMTALSVSDFIGLSIPQVKFASLAGLMFDSVLLIAIIVVAIKFSVLALLLFPLLSVSIVIIEFAFLKYGNDFWIFNHPSDFQGEIKSILNGTITDEKIIQFYEYRLYSKLLTKI